MKSFNKPIFIVLTILAPSILLRALGMDILLPSIPTIAQDFAVPFKMSQWILSVYFLGAGLGQLFVGPLADEYGRRKVLLVSTAVISISSVACAFTTNMWLLILMRFCQGLGACGTTVVSMAIMRDLYSEPTLSKVYSYFNSIISLTLFTAPIMGGFLLMHTGSWRSGFYFVAAFSFVAMLIDYMFVAETNPRLSDHKTFSNVPIIKSYLRLLKDPEYLYYCLSNVMGMSAMFLFFSMSSILLIKIIGMDPHTFGYYFGSASIMYFIGTLTSPVVQTKLKPNGTILLGSTLMMVAGLLMYFINRAYGLSALGLVLPNMLSTYGVGLLFGPCMAGVVKNYQNIAGIASAAYGALYIGGSSLLVSAIMHIEITDSKVMAVSLTLFGLTSIFAIRQIQKRHSKV